MQLGVLQRESGHPPLLQELFFTVEIAEYAEPPVGFSI
jgi:hypothetical protein